MASIARQHAEWLSLVEASGPFVSLPVLVEVLPQGLSGYDSAVVKGLRQAYEEWNDGSEGAAQNRAWVRHVLTRVLEFKEELIGENQAIPQALKAELAEHGETIRPDAVLFDADTKKPRILFHFYEASQELDRQVPGKRWKASPETRMAQLLRDTGVRLGIVTDGEQWMLVNAPKNETTGFISWYANLWLEEPLTLQAFRDMLGAARLFGVAAEDTLESLLDRSLKDQHEVTDQLGFQVRKAVEVLVQALDKADRDSGEKLLAGVTPETLYEASLTIMMRLVFLFCAEERGLLLLGDDMYDHNFAVSTLREQLQIAADQHSEAVLEDRSDAWFRLLTTFRAVYGGVKHDRLRLPAYGGSLFDPDRFPFLEGRPKGTKWRDVPAMPLPVSNRTVLHLLSALQLLQVPVPGGGPTESRKLSFRALDIEQIGHVYEGLLDHTAKKATEPVMGLVGSPRREPEVPLSELETQLAKGREEFVGYLHRLTGKAEKALTKLLDAELDVMTTARFQTACQGDKVLWNRIKPFANLVREDTLEYPVVVLPGSVYVTEGSDRRSTGTHYTPRTLTEPIVQYTLEPLVYVGPVEGKPKADWKLKTAKDLLELRICDMACGSGAFLVQACRYMADRLLEAWDAVEREAKSKTARITPQGSVSKGDPNEMIIPRDPEERRIYAMRLAAQRCLYGVDKNSLAVEMAKLSLWLLTLAKDKPFEFLDHSIRCGDSLVGLHNIGQLRHFSLRPNASDAVLFKGPLDAAVDEAIQLRFKLADTPVNSVEDVLQQEGLLKAANDKMSRLKCAADLLVAAEFWGDDAKDQLERVSRAAVQASYYMEKGPTIEFQRAATKERRGQSTFHWPLEFPEVLVRLGGFDAFVGNPPFMGGKKITTQFGETYRDFIVSVVANDEKGAADLSAYFLLRANTLTDAEGTHGLIATGAIADGDSERVGLRRIVQPPTQIFRAYSGLAWPGEAGVYVAIIWWTKLPWKGTSILDDLAVAGITSHLTALSEMDAHQLRTNVCQSFAGTYVNGDGFVLSPDEAKDLLTDPRNANVVLRYLIGDDINSQPNQAASRWVIDFKEMNQSEAMTYKRCFDILLQRVKPYRDTLTKQVHESNFWKFWDKRTDSYDRIRSFSKVLVAARASKYVQLAWVTNGQVYSDQVVVFITEDDGVFACLQSTIHSEWAWDRCTGMWGAGIRYAPSKAVSTFPLPMLDKRLSSVGVAYYRARRDIETARGLSLTSVYNLFHGPQNTSNDIHQFRELHAAMDREVARAYGWADLNLGHDFQETKQGVRFTFSEMTRREVLQRIMGLNQMRHAEEVKQDVHGKTRASRKKPRATKEEPSMFDSKKDE